MPPGSFEQYQIEEIRAENACIMARGFEYLSNSQIEKKLNLLHLTCIINFKRT